MTLAHLLFFDTFSHEVSNGVQLDLVQFPKAVQVSEVRVIPLGARVQADFPGGVRLGATNPSQFEIEFFVNDLSKRGAATFENVGNLKYNQHCTINLQFERKVPTDGLLLRGHYNTITLAVYGSLTKVQRDASPPPKHAEAPQPPPEKVNTHDRIRDWLEDTQRKQQIMEPAMPEDDPSKWTAKVTPPALVQPPIQGPCSPGDIEMVEEVPRHSVEKVRPDRIGRSELRDRKQTPERSRSREESWERNERSRKELRRESSSIDLEHEDKSKEEKKDTKEKKDKESKKDYERLEKIERERDLDKRRSREKYDDDSFEHGGTKGRRSNEEWEDRKSELSERSIKSGRRPQTPQHHDGVTPIGDEFSEEENPRDFRGPDKSFESREAKEPVMVLPPICTDEMEAISDDEDLPDLPMDENPPPDDYPPDEIMDDGLETVEDADVFGYEEIMSDEEELPEYQYEEEYVVDEWEDWLKPFSPLHLNSLPSLLTIWSPIVTQYESQLFRFKEIISSTVLEEEPIHATKLLTALKETSLPAVTELNHLEREASVGTDTPGDEVGEQWVQTAEQICQWIPQGLAYIVTVKSKQESQEIIATLLNWVEVGLDFQRALMQPQPVYKIRHLKSGIRLTYTMLQCSSEITEQLLNLDVMEKLFFLYSRPHMALCIKLFITKTIDITMRTKAGLEFFLKEETKDGAPVQNVYEQILQLTVDAKQTRAKVALAAIIRKINLLEVCERLSSDVKTVLKLLPPVPEDEKKVVKLPEDDKKESASPLLSGSDKKLLNLPTTLQDDDKKAQEPLEVDDTPECEDEVVRGLGLPLTWTGLVPEGLVESLTSNLQEITRSFIYADQLLAQPNRWLPGSKQFQLPKNDYNPYPQLYLLFERGQLLESISVLLSTPGCGNAANLIQALHTLISVLSSTDHGLGYLASNHQTMTTIVKTLLQFTDSREDLCDNTSMHQLGSNLIHMLHVIHQLDCISLLTNQTKHNLTDFTQCVVHFNALLSLMLSYPGKMAVINVLSLGKNVEIIFPFLRLDDADEPESCPCKIACFGYAVELFIFVVKFQDNVTMLENYADKIQKIIKREEVRVGTKSDEHQKLLDLIPWLSIVKNSENFSYDHLNQLSDIVKDQIENLEKYPGELITCLRILVHLAIPNHPVTEVTIADHNNELIEELKYKYATVQLFSSDLHTHLTNILTKLCSMYSQPFIYSANFMGYEGSLLLTVLKPTILLLKNILCHVIHARNTAFKDLTAIVPLLQTYLLLGAFPLASPYSFSACKIQKDVVSLLLAYTQPVYTLAEGEEVLAGSLWTKMMSEILKYMMTAPHTLVGTINLITEMLPIPLPIQARRPLSEEEMTQAVKLRKLWSAHLYPLNSTIHEIMYRLGLATHPALTHSLRRLCVALSDLSAPMSLLVARSTLDLILHTQKLDQKIAGEECETAPCSPQTSRVLNMVASLVSHAPTKAAMLHLLQGGSGNISSTNKEEKYTSLIPNWGKCFTLDSRAPAHIQAQESLVTIFQYMCNHENSMHHSDIIFPDVDANLMETSTGPITEVNLSSLPCKELLLVIIESLFEFLTMSISDVPVHQVMRILIKLLDHDCGFVLIKGILDKKKLVLFNLLKKQVSLFEKDKVEIIANLLSILEFSHLLVSKEQATPSRSLCVTQLELNTYLGWKLNTEVVEDTKVKTEETIKEGPEVEGETDVKKECEEKEETPLKEEECVHCLKTLETSLNPENISEDPNLEPLFEETTQIISILEGGEIVSLDNKDLQEVNYGVRDSLQSMFASRTVWTPLTGEDDASYWLSPPSFDEVDEGDTVKSNLMETCRQYASDYDLLGALHKLVKGHGGQSLTPQKNLCPAPFKPSATAIRPDKRGRPFVAPMRGRPYTRGMNVRTDPFRSRPPNTSRPPSVHVDVFQALESTGNQPTGPTGYNKISFGRGKLLLENARGRGRVRPDMRGRFFHRPMFRPDPNRGMGRGMNGRGRGMFVFRGDGVTRPNYRPPMNMGPGPGRMFRGRGPYMRGVGERFPPKFMERGRVMPGRHMRGFR